MKKSMKKKSGMKAMKSMKKSMKKGMKRKAKPVSKVAKGRGAKSRVFRGKKARTSGGLKKSDLTKNREGKIVSKKRSEIAKRNFRKNGLIKFTKAVQAARKALGIKGFQAVGGKSAKGQALLKKARSIYRK
jgi:hypothetical protein